MSIKNSIISSIVIGGALLKPNVVFSQNQKLNVLLFTADDLDRNSLGCYGSKVPGISPNLDRFASEGIRFANAYVNAAICAPSRGIIATGLYGHNSGVMGFMKMKEGSGIPLIMEIMRENSYRVGILSKVDHSTQKNEFIWDYVYDQAELGDGRSPSLYYKYSKAFFKECKDTNKPFYFMVNSDDPHRPYFNPDEPLLKGAESPSRIYSPGEIEVPGFLPDLPMVREELSHYYNSTKRLDDTFGMVMKALEESGFKENTLVIFISDNGIATPFAKGNAYYASNRTPWLVRWPGVIKPGLTDDNHYISEVDFLPTVLEAAGINPPEKLDGKSHLALYKGKRQSANNMVFTQIDNLISGGPVPMRSVHNREFMYIFNAWSDGERVYENNNEGMTMKAMEKAALTNPEIAKRVKVFRIRMPEEFYNLQKDPNCLHNLIFDISYDKQIQSLRKDLENWMIQTHDPLLKTFRSRYSPQIMQNAFYEAYPHAQEYDKDKLHYSRSKAKVEK